MPGSHRAQTGRRSLSILIAAFGVVLVAALAVLVVVNRGDDEDPGGGASDTTAAGSSESEGSEGPDATNSTATSAGEDGGSGASASAGTWPAPSLAALPEVADSPPLGITIDGLTDREFGAADDPEAGVLLPGSTDQVTRWAERGEPGSPGTDTVLLVGSVEGDDAFNGIPEVTEGAEVRIQTAKATLVYTVVGTTTSDDPVGDEELTATVPGRLVLIGTPDTDTATPAQVVVANLTAVE